MTEFKSNRKDRAELPRFDLASIFDEVPSDQDLKIVKLARRTVTPQKILAGVGQVRRAA